jgi:hypothetical protein
VNADRIPASIALVASSGMRASRTCPMRDASRKSCGSVDVDQCCSAGGKKLLARSPQACGRRASPCEASDGRYTNGTRAPTGVYSNHLRHGSQGGEVGLIVGGRRNVLCRTAVQRQRI